MVRFVSVLVLSEFDPWTLLSQLRAAFPEFVWEGGEGVFGRIHLAGESRERPSKMEIHLLCREPPGPFTLTIRLASTAIAAASEGDLLKARLVNALIPTMRTPTPAVGQRGPGPA